MRECEDKPFTAEDVRFTLKDYTLYAICLGWPGEIAAVKALGNSSPVKAEKIEQIQLLGAPEPLEWLQDDNGLQINNVITPTL